MRKAMTAAYSVGSAALILSATASAQFGPGFDFETITESNCNSYVQANIDSQGSCSVIATGTGFVQQQIDVNGDSYIQTIITETGFASEDFVKLGQQGQQASNGKGVASKLSVSTGTTVPLDAAVAPGDITTGFETKSTILAGWAYQQDKAQSEISVLVSEAQTFADQNNTNPNGDSFATAFSVDTEYDATTGENTTNSLVADQIAYMGFNSDNSAADSQSFTTRINGSAVTDQSTSGYSLTDSVGTANWTTGDEIQVVWIGQDMSNAAGVGSFGSETVQNNGDDTQSNRTSLTQTGPWDWGSGSVLEQEFGAAPSF